MPDSPRIRGAGRPPDGSSSPAGRNGYDGLLCQALGPDLEGRRNRAVSCSKVDGDRLSATPQYRVMIVAFADGDEAGGGAYDLMPRTYDTDYGFTTAQDTHGRLSSGVDADGTAVSVFVYTRDEDEGEPRARTVVVVEVPGTKNPAKSIEVMKRLPF